jgi:TrmH family RNA methyltransferase
LTLSRARQKLLGRLHRRKSREQERLFLVEGIRAGVEATVGGADITFGVVSPKAAELVGGEALTARLEESGVELVRVTDEELAAVSAAETPQGVLLVCREPESSLEQLSAGGQERRPAQGRPLRVLALDGLQDPGNVGTLVRVAAAFGLSGVIALEGTADLYGPKAVRASAGGVFRTSLVTEPWDRVLEWTRAQAVHVMAADSSGTDVSAVRATAPWLLVVGSEARGVRPEISVESEQRIGIPMPGGSESLNAAVAGSILLYQMTRTDSAPESSA